MRERVVCCTPPSCRTALCCLLHGRTCLPPCGKNDSAAVANDECSENTRTYAWFTPVAIQRRDVPCNRPFPFTGDAMYSSCHIAHAVQRGTVTTGWRHGHRQ